MPNSWRNLLGNSDKPGRASASTASVGKNAIGGRMISGANARAVGVTWMGPSVASIFRQ